MPLLKIHLFLQPHLSLDLSIRVNRTAVPPKAKAAPVIPGPSRAIPKLRPSQKARPKPKDRELDEIDFPTLEASFRLEREGFPERTREVTVCSWTTEQWRLWNQNQQASRSPPLAPAPSSAPLAILDETPNATASGDAAADWANDTLFDGADAGDNASGSADIATIPSFPSDERRQTTGVLLSYDFHNVLDCSWHHTHLFRERLWQEKPYWIRIRELVLSYSGVARAQETQRVLHRELPGVEFVRTNRPKGRSGKCALLTRLLRERGCTRVGHIDDRSDICEEITAGGLKAFCLDYEKVWISDLVPEIVAWMRTL